MSTSRDIDETLRQSIDPATMSEAESQALWARIEAGAYQRKEAGAPKAKTSRRFRLGGAVVMAASLAIAVVLVSPWDHSTRDNGPLSMAGLGKASASEVLNATAEAARGEPSLVPGPGQALFSAVAQYVDPMSVPKQVRRRTSFPGDEPFLFLEQELWLGPNGKGVEVSRFPASSGVGNGMTDRYGVDYSRFEPDPEGGHAWPELYTTEDLKLFPTDSGQALESLRDAGRQAAERFERSQGGPLPSLNGEDVDLIYAAVTLLASAPLTGEQRGALFDLILTAPDWHRDDGDVEITNEGLTTATDSDRPGIAIRIVSTIDPRIAKASGYGPNAKSQLEVILDPEQGRVLELRGGAGGQPTYGWSVFEALELRDIEEMPRPTGD